MFAHPSRILESLLKRSSVFSQDRNSGRLSTRRIVPNLEALECRLAMATDLPAAPQPPTEEAPAVLMVVANQDFYFQDYNDPRTELEAAGFRVEVAAGSLGTARAHWNSGQGWGDGAIQPDIALADVDASNYSAVIFVGGWGAASYQYAFEGTYAQSEYNGSSAVRADVNRIINDFVQHDKYIGGICYGVSVLAWSRVDGESLLDGRSVAAYAGQSPYSNVAGAYDTRWHIESNGGYMFASGAIGDPTTTEDDVYVDGKIITAQDATAGRAFGRVFASQLSIVPESPEPEPTPEPEPEPTPTPTALISIASSDAAAAEAHLDGASFTISRSGASLDEDLTVHYVVSGTAENGVDYEALSGTATILAGQDSVTVQVATVNDRAVEGAESVAITLVDSADYDLAVDAEAAVSIADNDDAVLMVIANQDFYYREYNAPRMALEAAGFRVDVAATTLALSTPHLGSGQGTDGGFVLPDLTLAQADAENYAAIIFVGGWGAANYQYAFNGEYGHDPYNGDPVTKAIVNELINDFVDQDKYVAGICYGVTALAWARVDGVSLLSGKTVVAPALEAPYRVDIGNYLNQARWQVEQNGANVLPSGSLGYSWTVADDVYVDGRIVTAENYDSAPTFGAVLVDLLMSEN